MATAKRARPVEGFYGEMERQIHLKAERIRPKKAEKVDQEKMYEIEVSAEFFFSNLFHCKVIKRSLL